MRASPRTTALLYLNSSLHGGPGTPEGTAAEADVPERPRGPGLALPGHARLLPRAAGLGRAAGSRARARVGPVRGVGQPRPRGRPRAGGPRAASANRGTHDAPLPGRSRAGLPTRPRPE